MMKYFYRRSPKVYDVDADIFYEGFEVSAW